MEYLIIGYPRGNGRNIELKKVTAKSKEEALNNYHKSIWYNYYVNDFNQKEYEDLNNQK